MIHDHNQNGLSISKTANGYIVELFPKMKRHGITQIIDPMEQAKVVAQVMAKAMRKEMGKDEILEEILEQNKIEPATPEPEPEMERVFVFKDYAGVMEFLTDRETYFNSEGSTVNHGYGPAVMG